MKIGDKRDAGDDNGEIEGVLEQVSPSCGSEKVEDLFMASKMFLEQHGMMMCRDDL